MAALDGERVLIAGGSSGIGLGTAKVALEAGAQVTIAGRSPERLAAAAATLGGKVETVSLDATSDADVEAYFAKCGTWDHIVTSLGKGGRGLIQDLDMKTALTAMDDKFWAYFRIARAAKIAKGGSLTFITGGLGQKPAPAAAMLSASNAAVEGLTLGLAVDFAPTRVNAVSPGPIDTPLWEQMPPDARKQYFEMVENKLPAKRFGEPEDVGKAVVMLMTNSFMTGVVFQVDGGSAIV